MCAQYLVFIMVQVHSVLCHIPAVFDFYDSLSVD